MQSALVDEFDLPLLESTVDLALVVHGLELTDSPIEMLQEVWRVMAPQGRLILVVPNRRGLWAAFDSSPFGYGQPFSRTQLAACSRRRSFQRFPGPMRCKCRRQNGALSFRGPAPLNGYGDLITSRFSGVIIVEAVKQVYAFSSGKRVRRLMPRFKPALLPSPVRFDGGK